MYKVVIIDDEKVAIDILIRKLKRYPEYQVVGMAQDGENGLRLINDEQPDVLFLDVEMPDMTGIDFLEKLREVDHDCDVVMCTSYDEFMLEAFRNNAFDYLLKPIDDTELETVMHRLTSDFLQSTKQQQCKSISKQVDDSFLFYLNTIDFQLVKIQDIALFQYNHDQRVWEVIVAQQTNPIRLKRNVINETLLALDDRFVQVNQKYIINIGCLMRVKDNFCIFRPPFDHIDYVKVGRFFRKKLIERFRTL